MSDSETPWPTRLVCPEDSPGKDTGLPFPAPGDLPDPGVEPRSPALEADALTCEPPGKPLYTYPLVYFTELK